MPLKTFGLKFRTKDPKLNMVFEGIRTTLNELIDHANKESKKDELAKVGSEGIPDYLNAGHFERTQAGHIKIKQNYLQHGMLSGLHDDDHSQYALLAGRSSGQILIGGTAANDDLELQTTSDATKGDFIFRHGTIKLYDTDDSNYLGFIVPDISGDVTYTLPLVDGSASDFLQTDGAGTLSWAATAGASINCFTTITGITNDVVADASNDTLTLTTASGFITITGTTATDTIDFVPLVYDEDNMVSDSDTYLATQQSIKAYVDAAVVGTGLYGFKTITGITNDVVADAIDDTLTLASANNRLTIVGAAASDTITWTLVEGNIDHGSIAGLSDGDHDAMYYTETEVDIWRNGVTQTEMGYVNGVTSDIQTQFSGKQPLDTVLTELTALTDPGADKIAVWDESVDNFVWLTLADEFSIDATPTLSIDHDLCTNFAANEHYTQANITATGTIASGVWQGTSIGVTWTDAKCTDATADNTATNETSHATVVVDADFGSAGLCATNGSGTYSIVADASGNWNTAHGWGDHAGGGYAAAGANSDITSLSGITGTIATPTGITMSDGGTIGNTTAIINFDETNSWLEITGSVGIGTATPGNKLHVYGSGTVALEIESNTDNAYLYINSNTDGVGKEQSVIRLQNESTTVWDIGKMQNDDFRIHDYVRNGDIVYVKDNGDLRLMEDGGNVGIGTTVPTALLDINSDILRLRTAKTPASAGAGGNTGDICWDASYLYLCTATDTWRRVAHATW